MTGDNEDVSRFREGSQFTQISVCDSEIPVLERNATHPWQSTGTLWEGKLVIAFEMAEQVKLGDFLIVPWAWDGEFGAGLSLSVLSKGRGWVSRVYLNKRDANIDRLSDGSFVAVFSNKAKRHGTFVVDYTHPKARRAWQHQLEQLSRFTVRTNLPDVHFLEHLGVAQKLFSNEHFRLVDRAGIGWQEWFRTLVDWTHEQLADVRPKLNPVQPNVPAAFQALLEACRQEVDISELLKQSQTLIDNCSVGELLKVNDGLLEASYEAEAAVLSALIGLAVNGPVSTKLGTCVPFLDAESGRFKVFEIDTKVVEKRIGLGEYWKRIPYDWRLEWGKVVNGSDIPISILEFRTRIDSLPRAETPANEEVAAASLLAEARKGKKWTIPNHARVALPFGPFSHLEITERFNNILIVCRTEQEEFYVFTLEPDNAFCSFDAAELIACDRDVAERIDVAAKLLFSAIVRDFWVVDEREKVFGERIEREMGTSKASNSGPRTVYLPRIRYVSTANVDGINQYTGPSRIRHSVTAHLRKGVRSSQAQLALAKLYGFEVPNGYTFVRSHARGDHQRETIYRSRSALASLYQVETGGAGKVRWFEFERDVRDWLESQGFDVEHVAASKRGDNGVDVYATKGHDLEKVCWIVQCKCWSPGRKVGPDVVRDLTGALDSYPKGTRGMIVTTSQFTSGAVGLSIENGIRLVDGVEFAAVSGTVIRLS